MVTDYYAENKEHILHRQRIYNLLNKDKRNGSFKTKKTCLICNCEVAKRNYGKHIKSPKHLNNIAQQFLN